VSTPSSPAAAGGFLGVADSAVAAAYKGTGRNPAPGPAAVKGKHVYVISCGAVIIGCQIPAAEVATAGKYLGWTVTVLDGKVTPAGYASAISQAVSAKADGIITIGIDCSLAKSAYQQAAAARIPTVGTYEIDCGDPAVGGTNLMTTQIDAGTGQDVNKWFYNWGVLKADYIIAKTHGTARLLEVNLGGFTDLDYMHKGIDAEMAKCTSCKVLGKVEIPLTDVGTPTAQTEISSGILKYGPQVNSVMFDSDTALTSGIPVLKANPHPNWVIEGNEGLPNTLPLITQSVVTGMMTMPTQWLGWCAAYTMNEVFAKHPVTDCGIGFQIADKAHNAPAPNQQFGDTAIDYRQSMKSQWAA
jgi:hypothetical protein